MTKRLILLLTGLLLLTAACGEDTTPTAGAGPTPATEGPGLSTVLFLGDSTAVSEALPLAAAFKTGSVTFRSLAAEGGGNVVGPFAEENWKKLPGQITSAKPSVVVYQLSTFDWGSQQAQQAAYRKLLSTVTATGAKLVFVTAPPIKPDDFYKPHLADLERAPSSARAVADGSAGQASLLDASEVWGKSYQRLKDGKVDRSTDGIHPCQQGAARFANWLLGKLAEKYPGFTAPDPQAWANAGWSADKHFKGC